MSVDILAIWNNNRKKQEQDMNTNIIQPAWIQKEKYYSENMMDQPEAKVTVNPLDRQVEIGVWAKITPMSKAQKQQYADNLSDYKRAMMQRYKAEWYSFEASKELVNQMDELANPNARWIDKYKDYEAKEQYYNRNGGTVDPDSTLYKVWTFLQKIWFNDQEKNPLNKLAQDYMQWYANEREAVDTIMEDEEANLAERFWWWLQRSLLSAEAGIIGGIGKIWNAVTGVEDIKESAMTATLDRLIKWYDTDLDFYREDDRRLDEYLWEGASGWLNTLFWAWAPKIMTAFSALWETKAWEWTMEKADWLMKKIIGLWLKVPWISDYYKSLDEQWQEDMLDTLTTLWWMELAKRTGKWTGKMKISRKYQDIKNQFKVALDRWIEGAKEQAKAEVKNVKEATDLYNEWGKKIWSMGPEWEVGAGKSVSRIVRKWIDEFKQSYIDRYNARHGGTVAEPGAVEPEEPVVGKPNNESKGDGVIQKGKDIIQEKWTDITTWLTPEERIRIQNDPYVADKFNKALWMINEAWMPLEDAFITEQLYNEVWDKILQAFDEWENKLQNTLPEYKALRELNTTYNLVEATPLLTDLLLKNDITQDPVSGELDFSNSKFVSDADMRSVQRAIDMIYKDIATLVTPRQYLNLRDKLDQLAKYTTVDASRGQWLIRQIRHTLDWVAKKQIPGLKELDDTTSKYFKEIAELKDWWVYKGGDRKWEIRNNFYSIIKNLTWQNRHVMLQRLERYYPGVTEEIEAIHLTNKLIKAYNKSPQIVKSLWIWWAIGWGIMSWWNIVTTLLWAILGELINKWLVEPRSKVWRRNAINKLLSEMSPEAQAKLEEIARRQTYAKEISAEDQRILDGVAEIIIQERNRWLSEEAIRERERRTRPLDQEALPGVQPDIVDENGNITLGRWNVISPDKGPGRARRLTRINEINLKNPETTPDKQVLDLQEKLDIDTDTAREIQSTIDDFLKDVGANEEWAVGWREVNYEKFTTRSLEKLMDNDNLPRTEKEKIKEILAKRWAEEEAMSEVKADWDFAMRIRQLSEEEQRIGKVGKNKVSKEVADKQMREWEKKKEALIKEMQDYYWIDQFEASDKYLDMEAKWDQYIREYKRSNVYKTETAEREVLDSLMEWWSKQPKFVRDMTEEQLSNRQDLINNIELQNWYKLETTNYNDRYLLERDGNIVDKGAIKYLDDGRIEVTAQTIDGLKSSGLLDQLPENAIIKVTGEELSTTAGDLRWWEYQIDDLDNTQRITSKEAMQLRDIRWKTAQELADDYWLTVDVVEAITTPDGRNALGRARNWKIEILENPDISTIHHEIFHPVFNMVDPERRVEIMEGLQERKWLAEWEAKEWLAENFSEYARTGEFDKADMPKTFRQKIKAFFKKVLDRIKGIRSNKEQIKELYDDILDGKIKKVKLENWEYEYQVEQKSLFDQESEKTKLEMYLKDNSDKIDIYYKTYDPDIVEWKNNLQKKGFWHITMNELYEVKNMIEEHTKHKWTQIDVPDWPTVQLLLERAESMAKDRIWTYDRKQIEKIGSETEKIIENRIADIDIRYDRGDVKDQDLRDIRADEFEDFKAEYVYQLWKTYNPDVEKRYDNFKKALKEITKGYEWFKGMTRFWNVVQPNWLNSLRSKVKELEKYSYNDIYNAFEGTYTDQFMKGIEEAKKTLDAEEIDRAVTNLVAISNMSVENFERQMKGFGGKSPMPSIAVMDVNVPHEVFGELTLVFGRDTIDPKIDPANKIYASDAWTPTFPEIKDKWSLGDYDKVKQMSSDVVDVLYNRWLDIDSSDLWYFAEELKSQLLDLEGRVDLDVNAERLAEQVFWDSVENLENDNYWIKNLSEKVADTWAENTVVDMLTDFIRKSTEWEKVIPARYFDKTPRYRNADQVAEELVDYVPDEVKENYDEGISWLNSLQSDILKVLNKNTDVKDRIANLLDALEMSFWIEYSPEVEEIVRRLELEEEWDRQLTPENVLEAMKNQRLNRPTRPWDFEDMIEIEWTELKDIEDVRKQNFAKVFHGDWTGDLGDLKQRYENLIEIIREEYAVRDEDGWMDAPDPQVVQAMIKDEYSPDIDEFMENLEENPLLSEIPEEVAQRIIDVVEQGKKIPIRFSESKPERIVDLTKEVEYILVPEGKDTTKVENAVKWTPLEWKVVSYKPDNYSAPRSKKMKELQKKYGNVFFSMWWVIMPIAMLYLMMNGEDEGQA